MKYTKPSLTCEEQAELLIGRGLVVGSKVELIEKLKSVNYYRLSAYWFPFRQPDDRFKPGTTLALVWQRYTFDRKLRLLVMDAVERVEIAIRTQLVYRHTQCYGPFGYLDRKRVPNISDEEYSELLERVGEEVGRSHEDFVEHFFSKYSTETDLPLWMACELMTFGNMLTFFRGTEAALKQAIAAEYGLAAEVLKSWLLSLNHVRNICAHHGRLWDRFFRLKPLIPKPNKHPEWHRPIPIANDRTFGALTILRYLLNNISPLSTWKERLVVLLNQYPEIPKASMGFPDGWETSPIWR